MGSVLAYAINKSAQPYTLSLANDRSIVLNGHPIYYNTVNVAFSHLKGLPSNYRGAFGGYPYTLPAGCAVEIEYKTEGSNEMRGCWIIRDHNNRCDWGFLFSGGSSDLPYIDHSGFQGGPAALNDPRDGHITINGDNW